MDLGLKGKVALVTASSEGVGFASALQLAKEGCKVALCARRKEGLEKARSEITSATGAEVLAVQADLESSQEIQNLVEVVYQRYGRIDLLVANTGHIPYGGLFDHDDAQWYKAFDLLLMSAVRLSRRVIPIMKAQGGGDIVFISSAVAREPAQHLLLSNIFRVGVVALAKSLSQTFASDNIRVNSITLGYFDTGRVRKRLDEMVVQRGMSRHEAMSAIAGGVPIGRIGRAEECGSLVAFLLSRCSEYLVGATIQIDGGQARSIF